MKTSFISQLCCCFIILEIPIKTSSMKSLPVAAVFSFRNNYEWQSVEMSLWSDSSPVMCDFVKLSLLRCFSGKTSPIHTVLTETKRCGWQTWMSTCHVALKLTYGENSFHPSLSYLFWVKCVSVLLTSQNSVMYSVLTLLLP